MSIRARCILVVVVGAVLGLTVSLGSSVLGSRSPSSSTDDDRYGDELDRIAEVIEHVRREYVDAIDADRLVASAIRGILDELDQHSKYLDTSEYTDIQISAAGNYAGVGLDIAVTDGKVTVVAPIAGTPAERAGILPGDVIVSVDEFAIEGDDINAAVSRMRGTPGTAVTVAVHRAGEFDARRFALMRSTIHVRTARGVYLGDGIGYLKISGFSDSTGADLETAVDEIRASAGVELAGLVLDLRNNPGGVLDAAVTVADAFLDDGLIVRGSGRAGDARFERYAHPGDALEEIDVVALVNAGSASASEIVAGAIKAHGRGRLVGERTYGKASVQTVMPLAEGRAIKLTTSRYFTASGASINGRGLEPDLTIRAEDPKALFGSRGVDVAPEADDQLQAALRLLDDRPLALSRAR